MSEQLLVLSLCVIALCCLIFLIFRLFRLPHSHRFTTYHPGMCRYGQCWCGAGIDLDEAARDGIPIYWRESGQRVKWDAEYITSLQKKHKEQKKAD